MTDSERHIGKRKLLIESLREKGIQCERTLRAMMQVPRHLFLDSSLEDLAYSDQALPIAAGQTISQPYTVAFQTMHLEIQPGEKVLEIGTGSGYQASVLFHMGAKVFTIERQWELFRFSKLILTKLGIRYTGKFGDGTEGMPTYAPFDKIIVTAGASRVPPKLLQQLKPGGKLIIPVGEGIQKMTLISKKSEKIFTAKVLGDFKFVPLLEDKSV
ncbi:protein-L-isoaspartate(D-aspartate) O-methyltransferase [Schleiferia thermophila]|jgi:protein-L-isoaspartate(D-aspartate) O-methyltransferase|uniref:protein-L-isoaspartate(D-aspartate) O-methyltransferase n=1 Tax=Schleiferia thermophila TaxID=884107 RepID=UPI0004E6D7D3|nr:protein-L-isoaspartate(D-aspartate) O-methyltransferase [Schleiferia thermophila]KFD39155.1 protein-L-isoaspartate O-methyltransferase [Schleiferia thermophila str. Yellowstone]